METVIILWILSLVDLSTTTEKFDSMDKCHIAAAIVRDHQTLAGCVRTVKLPQDGLLPMSWWTIHDL